MALATKRLRHQDYTVAWVCALPLEMAVAEAMLDEKHNSLPTSPGDDNTYILGSVFAHNVVIACLPSGIYGTTSAATLASQIRNTFQSIRFGLMVGIGGGVPSTEHDIRLGDVVVSKPTRDFGGVIQFDYGKTTAGGQFERTGVLNKPPSVLLTAISRIQAAHMSSPSQVPIFLDDAAARNPSMKVNFTYCGEEQDQLFEFDYEHVESQSTCDKCDHTKLITRSIREENAPHVHYGLIASGNQVMKYGQTRQKLAQELGILCFEMEAAGLMDSFPCLVVRGICDYSDSHKNKQWQPYAAATAAAYAKELLSAIHASRVAEAPVNLYESDPQIQMRSFSNWISLKSDIEDDKTIFERISTYDHEKAHQRLSRKRLVGTTQWFLDHPEFKAWFENKYTRLWCSGKIGSGKTIIAASVVEAAKYRSPSMQAPTIFFYCEEAQHASLEGSYVLSSLIKQLCAIIKQTNRPFPEDIKSKIVKYFGRDRIRPEFEDLEDIFIHLFRFIPNTIYVVDGIDSLDRTHSARLLKVFRMLFDGRTSSQGSKILLLSRDQIPGYIDVTAIIPGIRRISTSSNVSRDIEVYIEASIADKSMERKLTDDSGLLEEIKQVLLSESSEMFLWVYLQLEILWNTCFTDAGIRSSLSQLPKGLEETYCRCIERIGFSETCALKVLKWVSFATYPLHIEELREAVAFDIEDDSWDAAKIPRAEFIIGCCANLVVVDPTDNCVRFAHSSVRQFLDNNRENYILGYPQSAEEGQLECGELCIAYLSFSNFGLELVNPDNQTVAINVPIPTPISLAGESLGPPFTKLFSKVWKTKTSPMPLEFRRLQAIPKPGGAQYRFLNYATVNWALQTKHINVKSPMWHKFKQLAFTFNESWNFHPWMSGGRSALSRLHSLFGWAVKEQHVPLLALATKSKKDIKEVCDIPLIDEGLPALHVAAKFGYKQMLKVLLDICTVNRYDKDGFTALHHAVIKRHLDIVKILSSTPGVDIDARSSKNLQRSPLWVAAHHGRLEIATLLISKGADLNVKDATFGRTPLFCAVECGNFGLVEVLIQNGCDVNSQDYQGRTPLLQAMKNNDPITSRLLLEKTVVMEGRGSMLLLAAENKFETIMELLLVNATRKERLSRDSKGLTPLHWAVKNGFETITSQILTHSDREERTSKDNEGLTPLHWAARNGFETITSLILFHSSLEEIPSKDNEGLTPLHWAARNGFETTVKQLLVYATPQYISSRDYRGRQALHLAVMHDHIRVVLSLLEKITNINCVDNWGQTPLMLAVQKNNIPIIELLVENGAEPGFRDDRERSSLSFAKTTAVMSILYNDFTPDRYPLIWAVVEGNEEAVASLLEQGIYPDDIGPGGYTALYWATRNNHKAIIKLLKKYRPQE